MNRFAAMLITLSPLTLVSPVWGGGGLPEPSSYRIVLHGVDCSIDSGTVCDEERPVFDEALATVPDTAAIVIESSVAEGLSGEPASTLERASGDAVREYFISEGIAPEQVELQGCTATPRPLDWSQLVDVQLAKRFQ